MAKWMQKAAENMAKNGTKGSFTEAAKKHHKGVQEFAREVLSEDSEYSAKMRKKAAFAKAAASIARKHQKK